MKKELIIALVAAKFQSNCNEKEVTFISSASINGYGIQPSYKSLQKERTKLEIEHDDVEDPSELGLHLFQNSFVRLRRSLCKPQRSKIKTAMRWVPNEACANKEHVRDGRGQCFQEGDFTIFEIIHDSELFRVCAPLFQYTQTKY